MVNIISVGVLLLNLSKISLAANAKRETEYVAQCHFHGDTQFCIDNDGLEGTIIPSPLEANAPSNYTGCHSHGTETFCLAADGSEVQFAAVSEQHSEGEESGGKKCHFHAGVEHCVDHGSKESTPKCERVDRDYNIKLRIGTIFAILATSGLGVFGPIFLARFFNFSLDGIVITCFRQFGAGVILSTAFVHLTTHAALMWGNSCIKLTYESTSTAITMAGVFLVFFIEYVANRIIRSKQIANGTATPNSDSTDTEKGSSIEKTLSAGHLEPNDKFSVFLMECGIVFHSILIGVTLVVAGDSYFITLFIVIIFHQMFEGVALGSRIACITDASLLTKIAMASCFALITPIGMAIGTGTLHTFNGNDPSTIIALGTLDALSAGVLIWTGLVEMLAHDWLFGYLATANWIRSTTAMISLVAGMILMSFIGKWA